MRRLPHILLNAATAASLVLCIVVLFVGRSNAGVTPTFEWPLGDAAGGIVLKRTPLRAAFDGSRDFLLLMFLTLPTVRLIRFAVDRSRLGPRTRPDRCPTCNYDLRATPARCPECGAVPPTPPPA